MQRLHYKSNSQGLLASKEVITLKDSVKVAVLIDQNTLEFNIVNIETATSILGGSGKNLRQLKRSIRIELLKLGANLGIEIKSPVKKAALLLNNNIGA